MATKFLVLCLGIVVMANATPSYYVDNDVGQSVPMELVPTQQKEAQEDLLELIGLYTMPKTKSNDKMTKAAYKFMKTLYDSIKDVNAGEEYAADGGHIHITDKLNSSALGLDPAKVESADVIVSFVNKANRHYKSDLARKLPHLRHKSDNFFYFNFSEGRVGEQGVKGAELRLYKDVSPNQGTFTLKLHTVKQKKDLEGWVLELQSSQKVEWQQSGWLTLDATKAAEHWGLFPYQNEGLYLMVEDAEGKELHPHDIGIVGKKGPAGKQSFLVGYMSMTRKLLSRRTRSAQSKPWANSNNKDVSYADNAYSRTAFGKYRTHSNCQRHNLYINFRAIGMDSQFLIAPEGYSAYYCAGDCSFPLSIHMNATNHAIVQTLVHLMEPNAVPKTCCAPTQFGPITILYYDDNSSVVLKKFPNMIVKACGCH